MRNILISFFIYIYIWYHQVLASVNNTGVLDLDNRIMKDIYDIWPDIAYNYIDIFASFIYIIVFLLLYFLYKQYNKYKYIIFIKNEKEYIEKTDYIKLINDIWVKYIESEKNIFYQKIAEFIRNYLDKEKQAWLSTKTLKELKNNIDIDLYKIIENIYFPEYDYKEDDLSSRLAIIEKIKKYLEVKK